MKRALLVGLLFAGACGPDTQRPEEIASDAGCSQWVTGGTEQCDPLPDGGSSIVCRWVTTATCVDVDGGTP